MTTSASISGTQPHGVGTMAVAAAVPARSTKILVDRVSKRFATDVAGMAPVLEEVTLDIAENEFVVLLGRSGCGKNQNHYF